MYHSLDLVYDYLFTSQRGSHSVPDMEFFATPSLILSHLKLLRIELPKLTKVAKIKYFDELVYLCIFI